MKRSEALKIIEANIEKALIRHGASGINFMPMVTKYVLNELEHAGMVPPCRPSDEKVIRCQVREWEPENN